MRLCQAICDAAMRGVLILPANHTQEDSHTGQTDGSHPRDGAVFGADPSSSTGNVALRNVGALHLGLSSCYRRIASGTRMPHRAGGEQRLEGLGRRPPADYLGKLMEAHACLA